LLKFLTKDVENAMNYLKENSQGETFTDMPTQQRQEYFSSQEYMYKNSDWNPNTKEFYYIPNMITKSDKEILSNQLSEQTWYERQKGAEERFDVLSKGGDGLAAYGAKKENPLLIGLGTGISFGSTTLSNLVTPDKKTDAEIINSYLPWYFQLTDLNPKIEEEK
jgi:SOS-response transcriptional repressor LexA